MTLRRASAPLIGALLCIAASAAIAQSVENVSINGAKFEFPVPQSQCTVKRDTEYGQFFLDETARRLNGMSALLVVFADCDEIKLAAQRKLTQFKSYTAVTAPFRKGGTAPQPFTVTRKQIIEVFAQPSQMTEQQLQAWANSKLNGGGAVPVKIEGSNQVHVGQDDNAAYRLTQSTARVGDTLVSTQCLTLSTLFHGYIISVDRCGDAAGESAAKLLRDAKDLAREIARLTPN